MSSTKNQKARKSIGKQFSKYSSKYVGDKISKFSYQQKSLSANPKSVSSAQLKMSDLIHKNFNFRLKSGCQKWD
jgi:hypothetical protein